MSKQVYEDFDGDELIVDSDGNTVWFDVLSNSGCGVLLHRKDVKKLRKHLKAWLDFTAPSKEAA